MKATSPLFSVCTNIWCKHIHVAQQLCIYVNHSHHTPANGNKQKKEPGCIHPVSQRAAADSPSRQPREGRGRVARPGAAPLDSAPFELLVIKKTTMTHHDADSPSTEAANSRCFPVTVQLQVNAQVILGGGSLSCGRRSIRAGEGRCLCGHQAQLLLPPTLLLPRCDVIRDLMQNSGRGTRVLYCPNPPPLSLLSFLPYYHVDFLTTIKQLSTLFKQIRVVSTHMPLSLLLVEEVACSDQTDKHTIKVTLLHFKRDVCKDNEDHKVLKVTTIMPGDHSSIYL